MLRMRIASAVTEPPLTVFGLHVGPNQLAKSAASASSICVSASRPSPLVSSRPRRASKFDVRLLGFGALV